MAGIKLFEERALQRYKNSYRDNIDDARSIVDGIFKYVVKRNQSGMLTEKDVQLVEAITTSMSNWGKDMIDEVNNTVVSKLIKTYEADPAFEGLMGKFLSRKNQANRLALEAIRDDVSMSQIYRDYATRMLNTYEKD